MIHLQFLWHLHQPYYGLPGRASNTMPWVRLHSVKSYYDMGRMLERHPQVRGVLNFSGSLLRQLIEYVDDGKRDTWWTLTLKRPEELSQTERVFLVRHFFSIDWDTCIRRYPRYAELLEMRGSAGPDDAARFSDQDLRDLQVWFNLAWLGFSARDERPIAQELIAKGAGFTEAEKEALLEQHIEIMRLIAPMYRGLHRRGQIELSVTPMYHPILPLIIDTDAARRATPDRPRPPRTCSPDDAREHVRRALLVSRSYFDVDVDGMWPAEGSVSPEASGIFSEFALRWIASDEDVLHGSLGAGYQRQRDLMRPWSLGSEAPAIFFRDRQISDQIGFHYSKAEPHAGAQDLLRRVREQGQSSPLADPVVSVILDGENPWEHYPDDGQAFLDELYRQIEQSSDIESTTPSRFLDAHPDVGRLEHLHSGSWILGNYQIWIGHEETNRAWEMLGHARAALTDAERAGDLPEDALATAYEALLMAQGSDWFWWYGDDFSSENDADFDRLFRDQLRVVYRSLRIDAPPELDTSIMSGAQADVIFDPPRNLIRPQIDGRTDFFYEWSGAGVYRPGGGRGSMFDGSRYVREINIGFDLENLYVRVEPDKDLRARLEHVQVVVQVRCGERAYYMEIEPSTGEGSIALTSGATEVEYPLELVAFQDDLEFAVPFAQLGAKQGDLILLNVSVRDDDVEVERHPQGASFELTTPDDDFEARNWMV